MRLFTEQRVQSEDDATVTSSAQYVMSVNQFQILRILLHVRPWCLYPIISTFYSVVFFLDASLALGVDEATPVSYGSPTAKERSSTCSPCVGLVALFGGDACDAEEDCGEEEACHCSPDEAEGIAPNGSGPLV